MRKRILNIGIPLTLLVVAIFIIGPACSGDPDEYNYNWYPDNDQDGFGDFSVAPTQAPLSNPPVGYVQREGTTDCDDSNADVYPGAIEIPDNLIDEDCNGKIAITFYDDKDEDGFGNPDNPVVIEIDDYNNEAPNGYSWFAGDCDDNNAAINPKADEIPENGIDDNCDGEIDIVERYIDADGDGYGSQNFAAAEGVTNNLDCDDTNEKIHPYTKEIIGDSIDSNCDGLNDIVN